MYGFAGTKTCGLFSILAQYARSSSEVPSIEMAFTSSAVVPVKSGSEAMADQSNHRSGVGFATALCQTRLAAEHTQSYSTTHLRSSSKAKESFWYDGARESERSGVIISSLGAVVQSESEPPDEKPENTRYSPGRGTWFSSTAMFDDVSSG